MITIEEAQREVMNFGKHKGETLQSIVRNDAQYLGWLHEQADVRTTRLREAVEVMAKVHAADITASRAQPKAEDDPRPNRVRDVDAEYDDDPVF